MLGAEDEKAKVTISGNEKLETGENTIKVTVTAEDGTAKTYNISTTKEEKEKLQLSKLQITGITLNETFKPDKYEYSIDLNGTSNITKLDIKATANDETATIEILGNDNFVEGENVVTIMVKSKDGNETATYQIVINKSAGITTENNVQSNEKEKTFLYVAIGICAVAVLLIIIVIVKSRKSSDEDFEDEEYKNYDDENNFGLNNNYTEELYSKRKENKVLDENKTENSYQDKNDNLYSNGENNDNKLYDIEKEVDFSDDEEKPRRKKGGKHSK